MQVLIVGSGYVGARLLARLDAKNIVAWGVRRSAAPGSSPRLLRADVTQPPTLRSLPDDITHVVYAVSPGQRDDEAYRLAYPTGLSHILARYPAARVSFISSTAVYGQTDGAEVDDSSPAEATSFSAKRLREAEALALAQPHSAVLRASGIYGPGRNRLLARLVHHPLEQDERETWTNRIHVDDLVSVLEWVLKDEERGGTFVASDPHPVQLGNLQEYVRAFAGVGQWLEAPTATERRLGRQNRRIVPRRLLDGGFEFGFPSYQAGYASIIAHLGDPAAARSDKSQPFTHAKPS